MTTEQAQLLFEQLVKKYFAGTVVRWCETNQVKPPYPFVVLKLTNVSRSVHPDEYGDEEIRRQYLCTGRVTLNLYTGGRKSTAKPGMTSLPPRNTAVSDLQGFLHFLGSDAGQDFLEEHNISILEEGNTLDVSALLNESKYEYRAQQEFVLSFVDSTTGHSGVTPPAEQGEDNTVPSPSGGGTPEQSEDKTGWFESAQITQVKEDEAENE